MSFDRYVTVTTKISRLIALIGLAGLLVLSSATVLDVLLRWLCNRPIVGLNDTYSMFAAIVIASSFPLCIAERGNVTIRFIGRLLGPRMSDILEAFGNLVACIIFILMAWQLWLYTDQLFQDGETTWILSWPVSPWWRIITILVMVNVPVSLVMAVDSIRSAVEKKPE